jgi:hypothetical protein
MCTILVEDEAGVWDAIRGLSELLGRVEAGTAPTDDEGRCGDLADPIPMSKASGLDRRIMTEGSQSPLINKGPASHKSVPTIGLPKRESVTSRLASGRSRADRPCLRRRACAPARGCWRPVEGPVSRPSRSRAGPPADRTYHRGLRRSRRRVRPSSCQVPAPPFGLSCAR